MNTNTQISRVYYLDVLRLVATLAVIMLHVCGVFMRENTIAWYVAQSYFYASKWCVPVFLMISGALFLQPAKQVSIKQLYTKYIFRLFICLVVWQLMYSYIFNPSRPFLLSIIHGLSPTYDHSPLIPYHYHLWFLPMMIGVYVLIPVFKLIVTNRQVIIYYLLLWFLFETYDFMHTLPALQIESLNYIVNSFNIRMVYGYSGYFLLGYFLSTIEVSKPLFYVSLMGGMVLLGITVFVACTDGFSFEDMAPNVILMSISVFVSCKYMFEGKLPLRMTCVIEYTRSDLFGIYLIHPFVLSFYLFPSIFKGPLSIIIIPMFTVVVFVISLYLTKGLRRIPHIKKIC